MPILITSISKWMLKDMVQASFYGDFSSIGTGTEEEIQNAYGNLLSQYYDAREDDRMRQYLSLSRQILELETNAHRVDFNVSILNERYSPAACECLRNIPPRLQWTEESYLNDITVQQTAEIANKIKFERLTKQREAIEVKSNESTQTPEQKHKALIAELMDISKTEGVRYDVSTMTVLEFAVAENRLSDYVDNLKMQAQK